MSAVAARRSDSFTRNSCSPHPRHALREGGDDGEDRIFVDHRGARSAARRRRAMRRRARGVGDLLAASWRSSSISIERPSPQGREQAGAQRIGHHAFQHDVEPGHDERAHHRERGEDGSAGTRTGAATIPAGP
jgi:hypothetical protein